MRSFSQSCSTTVQLVGLATRRGLRTSPSSGASTRSRMVVTSAMVRTASGVRELGAKVSAFRVPGGFGGLGQQGCEPLGALASAP